MIKNKCGRFSLVRKLKIILAIVFVSCLPPAKGSTDPGSWWMFVSQTRLHAKWSLHSELQFRSFEITPNTEQTLVRAGVNFHANPTTLITAGYGYIGNFRNEGNIGNGSAGDEHRVWEQLILRSNISRIFLEHRYRLEQRWINTTTGPVYRDRFRYLLRATVPLNKKTVEKNAFFVSVYDEVFLHLSDSPFDRNRLYGALGYQFSASSNVQLGYLVQTLGLKSYQYFQVMLNFNPDLRRSNE